MSTNILWTLLLKLLFVIGFFLFIVAPPTMLAWRVMPPGRLRDVLFKVRTGPSGRDKVIVTVSVAAFYATLLAGIALSAR